MDPYRRLATQLQRLTIASASAHAQPQHHAAVRAALEGLPPAPFVASPVEDGLRAAGRLTLCHGLTRADVRTFVAAALSLFPKDAAPGPQAPPSEAGPRYWWADT
jgi:hypothetical protein